MPATLAMNARRPIPSSAALLIIPCCPLAAPAPPGAAPARRRPVAAGLPPAPGATGWLGTCPSRRPAGDPGAWPRTPRISGSLLQTHPVPFERLLATPGRRQRGVSKVGLGRLDRQTGAHPDAIAFYNATTARER